jgi:hypothetical protein
MLVQSPAVAGFGNTQYENSAFRPSNQKNAAVQKGSLTTDSVRFLADQLSIYIVLTVSKDHIKTKNVYNNLY